MKVDNLCVKIVIGVKGCGVFSALVHAPAAEHPLCQLGSITIRRES